MTVCKIDFEDFQYTIEEPSTRTFLYVPSADSFVRGCFVSKLFCKDAISRDIPRYPAHAIIPVEVQPVPYRPQLILAKSVGPQLVLDVDVYPSQVPARIVSNLTNVIKCNTLQQPP